MELMRRVLAVTREELLLVDLEGLTPLLERKEGIIAEIGRVDSALAGAGGDPPAMDENRQRQLAEVMAAILENEQALEERMEQEFSRLKKELREFDRQTTLRRYLEKRAPGAGNIDLKK